MTANLNPATEAQKLLNAVWKEGFPVDPITIAMRIGVQVRGAELPDNISGALLKQPGHDPIILLHHSDSTNRKRFTCAHELGHYVARIESANLEENLDITAYEYVDLRGSLAANGTDPDEMFANAFAANLLMPATEVNRVKSASIFEMSQYFGVSNEAMMYRLKKLGIA
jgi:Zn-dependent peptidase ImmA (M78 family)